MCTCPDDISGAIRVATLELTTLPPATLWLHFPDRTGVPVTPGFVVELSQAERRALLYRLDRLLKAPGTATGALFDAAAAARVMAVREWSLDDERRRQRRATWNSLARQAGY